MCKRRSQSTAWKLLLVTSICVIVWVGTRHQGHTAALLLEAQNELEIEIATLLGEIKKTAQDSDSKRLGNSLIKSRDKLLKIKNFLQSGTEGSFHHEIPEDSLTQKPGTDGSFNREIPADSILNREYPNDKSSLDEFIKVVTVLIYADKDTDCVKHQIQTVAEILPNIRIIVASNTDIAGVLLRGNIILIPKSDSETEGQAMNAMISQVKTPYFLYLSQGAVVSPFHTDHGPGWLLHALLNVPELDFIGGSILTANKSLRYSQLEVQCYRLRMCYYVFSQSYEYKYSVGDVMICEETSTSFMARTTSVAKVGAFDETLKSMVTTDFFWRAKDKNIAGLRPEVFFHIDQQCFVDSLSDQDDVLKKQAFMEKYELVRVKDSYGKVTEFTPRPKFDYVRDGGFASPLMTEQLRYYLRFFDDFFTTNNITYFVDGGIPLGAIKMRNVLPWDTGDVDAGYFNMNWSNVEARLVEHCEAKKVSCSIVTGLMNFKDDVGAPPGLKEIGTKIGVHHGAHYDKYSHEWEKPPPAHELMYLFIDGVYMPVYRCVDAQTVQLGTLFQVVTSMAAISGPYNSGLQL